MELQNSLRQWPPSNEWKTGRRMNHELHWFKSHKHYSTLIVRVGIAVVFLWFGIDKFFNVANWIGWIPNWMSVLIPISLDSFMYTQGVIETIAGLLMLVGYQTRLASLISVLTLFGVEISLVGTGQTELMLRDAGLLAASLSLFLTGSDCLSIDCWLNQDG